MSQAPDQLTLERHRDLGGAAHRPVTRWVLLTLLGALVLLGLLNAFGQKPHTDTAAANGVELEVYSPERLRSGLFYMSRFTIRAQRKVEAAEELAAAARLNQLDSIDDVRWAVLETNGRISFIPKSASS